MAIDDLGFTALAWLGTYWVHSTLLLGAAILVARRWGSKRPRLAERTWRLALFGGLLTATLQVALGTDPVFGRWFLQDTKAAELANDTQRVSAPSPAQVAGAESDPSGLSGLGARAARPFDARDTRVRHSVRPSKPDASNSFRDAAQATARMARETALEPAERPLDGDSRSARTTIERSRPKPRGRERGERLAAALRADVLEDSSAHAPGDVAPSASEPNPLWSGATTQLARIKTLPWARALLSLWSLPALLGALWILWSWIRLERRLAKRERIVSGPLRDTLDRLVADSGYRGSVRLSSSSRLPAPITFRWNRPEICVPTRTASDLSPRQQESMLAHELAHVVRRDPLWFGCYALMERLFFFQPLNRVARRALQEEAELLCDDCAVRWTGQRLALASCLAEIAEWVVGRRQLALPAAGVAPGMASVRSALGNRVERLLDDRRSPIPEARSRWWTPGAFAALGVFVFAVPGVSASAESSEDPAPTHEHDWDPIPPLANDAGGRGALSAPARVDEASGDASNPGRRSRIAPGTAPVALGFTAARESLQLQLDLLTSELELLQAELKEHGLLQRYSSTLEALETKLQGLRSQQAKLDLLLRRLR